MVTRNISRAWVDSGVVSSSNRRNPSRLCPFQRASHLSPQSPSFHSSPIAFLLPASGWTRWCLPARRRMAKEPGPQPPKPPPLLIFWPPPPLAISPCLLSPRAGWSCSHPRSVPPQPIGCDKYLVHTFRCLATCSALEKKNCSTGRLYFWWCSSPSRDFQDEIQGYLGEAIVLWNQAFSKVQFLYV
jgi:hypothetical protein